MMASWLLLGITYYEAKTMDTERGRTNQPAMRLAKKRLNVALVCAGGCEVQQLAQAVLQSNSGCLVTFQRVTDLLHNSPAGKLSMIIVSSEGQADTLGEGLGRLRHRWPHCPLAVVGGLGSGAHELVARQHAAVYLTRPVTQAQWLALVSAVLHPIRIEKNI